jgi:hypothetical protein
VFVRIQRSPDGQTWEDVSLSNMLYWYTDIVATDNPYGLHNVKITPLNSKEAKIQFDNPWKTYLEDVRDPYMYRIRTEDITGEASPWYIFTISELYVMPKEILIRRKEDNGSPSSETGEDAFDVFLIDASTLDKNAERIELIDNQLTDATKYGYTIFYKDILNKQARILYIVSDHRAWANLLLYRGQTKNDKTGSKDFLTSFELADRIIEIGE